MDQRRAAAALLALAACFACSSAAPTSNNQTALDLYDAPVEGCYYNFQHYSEGDRIMTNEPCLNCTCHNRMLMCYLRVCPFTKPIGQDCTVEKRADQCCPIVTCPDVPVDLLTSTSTSSPAEYGATGLGKLDKYGCSINGKYFPEGSKVPPAPNKPCEHCYCIRNMTTCVMQECTLHVDGCTPIYHKDLCCPIRYSCDHSEDEIPLLDDMTTTARPTPGFLLTTTTMMPVTQATQDCVHDDQIFPDGALIKTEKACEHCYCMKGDIVCVVQECGTPMENEGKNCTSLPPRQGQCCPDTYICEGDETQTTALYEEITTLTPPRRVGVEGSGYRNEPDEPYTDMPTLESEIEGSGEDQPITTDEGSDLLTSSKYTPESTTEYVYKYTTEPDKGLNTVPDSIVQQGIKEDTLSTIAPLATAMPESSTQIGDNITPRQDYTTGREPTTIIQDEITDAIETSTLNEVAQSTTAEVTTKSNVPINTSDNMTPFDEGFILATKLPEKTDSTDSNFEEEYTTIKPSDIEEPSLENANKQTTMKNIISHDYSTVTTEKISETETTSIDIQENEISEDLTPGRIPGEGDCLLNSITYKNNSVVPSTSKCHSSCKCISSIIKCDPIICTPPLEYMENMNDCHPIYDSPESCCPTYVCNTKETIAPESHSQMSGTESPKPTIECAGDECKIVQESKPIIDHEDKGDCGETGCAETPVTQKDLDKCVDGKCDTHTIQYPITETKPCDSSNGCQAPAIKPCENDNCETKLESPIHDEKEDKPVDNEQPIKGDQDQEILCKEENCRRKEFSNIDHETPCEGNDCLHKEHVSPTIGIEISTQKSEEDSPTTKTEENVIGGLTKIESESTTNLPATHLEEIYTESSTASGVYTEQLQTTLTDVSEQSHGDSHHEEINTPSSHTHDISTERFEPTVSKQEDQTTEISQSDVDKINIPTLENVDIDEHNAANTESYESSKQTTIEGTEKTPVTYFTISDELSTTNEVVKVTSSKVETETSEYTKEITTESYITPETTKLDLTTVDKLIPSQRPEIYEQDSQATQILDSTTPSYTKDKTTVEVLFDESTSTNAPKLVTTISEETATENVNMVISTEKEIVNTEHTDKSLDESLHEVTEHLETSTAYTDKEPGSSVTFSDVIDHETPSHNIEDKQTPQVLESSTVSTKPPKENENHEYSSITEVSIDDTIDKSSTPIYEVEATENIGEYEKMTSSPDTLVTLSQDVKDLEDQKVYKPISTQLPEQITETTPSTQDDINQYPDSPVTQAEEIKTTPSIEDDRNQYSQSTGMTIDTDMTTHKPEAHSDEPTDVNTESVLYISTQETVTTENLEVVTKPSFLDNDLSENTSDNLDQQITTIKSSTKEEERDTFTASPEDITHKDDISNEATTVRPNIEEVKGEQTDVPVNVEETTKESEISVGIETKPSEEIQDSETDMKTTVAYNDYNKPTEEVSAAEIPVVLEQSTPPSIAATEIVDDTIAIVTVKSEDEVKSEVITTDMPAMSTEGEVIHETAVSSEKPKLEYTLAEEITEPITNMPKTDIPDTISSDKPASTTSDLSQELYPSTTTKSNEIAESTEKIEDNYSVPKEIVTEKMPGIPELGDIEKVTAMSAETNPTTSTFENGETEETGPVETETLITTQGHDFQDTTEGILATTSSIMESVTEQKIEEITDITHVKDKATEAPMSLVTDSQSISTSHEIATESISTSHEIATESIQKVTEIESSVDVPTESQVNHKKPSSDTTVLGESITTEQIEMDHKDISPSSEFTTEHKYFKPTTDISNIITTTASELSTARLFTSSPEISTENPLINIEQEAEKYTTESTHEINDLFMSTTTEKLQEQDENKLPEISEMTKENESSTEYDKEGLEKEKMTTEQSYPHVSDQEKHDFTEVPKTPTEEMVTVGHEMNDITTILEGTTKYPEYITTLLENEDSKKITEEELYHTTESSLELTTSSKEVTIKEQAAITVETSTTIKPDLIHSTISSDNEIVTKAYASISDSTVTEQSTYDSRTTEMENVVTENVLPDHPKTDIYQELQTKAPTVFGDENTTVPEKTEVDKSQESTVYSTESTKIPTNTDEEHITKISDENTNLSVTEPTVITSSEYIPDVKVTESETTTETQYKFSETTPYFVELEEHTHQIIQETTVIPVGEVSTVETTDTKSTERGDQLFTDISVEDSQTEKSHEATSGSFETHSTTQQFVDNQTSEEKYQTTVSSTQFDVTTISSILSQNETAVSEEKPMDFDEKTTISSLPNIMQNEERVTTAPAEAEKPTSYYDTKISVTTERPHDLADIPLETKMPSEDKQITKLPTSEIAYEPTTVTSMKTTMVDDVNKPIDTSSVTSKPITSKPLSSELQPTDEIPTPEFPATGYDQEPDYGEEDQAFGPGTCRYGGKVYVSAQQIPRDDPCDFCFCFRSDIICLQQSCPPPIHGCHEEPIQGFCCPRYECPVSMATTVNVTTTTTTTTTTLPPHFLPHAYKGTAQRKGCHIQGRTYKVGEVVRASSGPCLHCTCGGDGQMKCDPKACTPEPMLRQMIAAAVSARRRR